MSYMQYRKTQIKILYFQRVMLCLLPGTNDSKLANCVLDDGYRRGNRVQAIQNYGAIPRLKIRQNWTINHQNGVVSVH